MNWNNIILKYNILNIYPFGSQIYNTNEYGSDYDFILISKNAAKVSRENYYFDQKYNLNIIPLDVFIKQLNEHKISFLECIYLPSDKIIKQDLNIKFCLNKQKLFSYIERKSEEDFLKAFKNKDDLNWDRKKSIFHAIRIVDFATNLAKDNFIDYTSCKKLYFELKNDSSKDYNFYYDKYSIIYKDKLNILSKLSKGK